MADIGGGQTDRGRLGHSTQSPVASVSTQGQCENTGARRYDSAAGSALCGGGGGALSFLAVPAALAALSHGRWGGRLLCVKYSAPVSVCGPLADTPTDVLPSPFLSLSTVCCFRCRLLPGAGRQQSSQGRKPNSPNSRRRIG